MINFLTTITRWNTFPVCCGNYWINLACRRDGRSTLREMRSLFLGLKGEILLFREYFHPQDDRVGWQRSLIRNNFALVKLDSCHCIPESLRDSIRRWFLPLSFLFSPSFLLSLLFLHLSSHLSSHVMMRRHVSLLKSHDNSNDGHSVSRDHICGWSSYGGGEVSGGD